MRIYVDQRGTAPSPRRLRIYLAEKGIEVPYERLAIHEENRTPEFRKKNPLFSMPVLELDDGSCISESVAICRYFEELQPEPPLFGATPLEKATVDMWTRRIELYLYLSIEYANEKVMPKEVAERFRRGAHFMMKLLDQELTEREFIAGDRYTIADAFALSALDFGIAYVDFEIPEKRKNLIRWHQAVSSRPSAKA
ncbi:MAG: glutathione S-transferase family protein [Myxococcota bacterium]